jgi:hypothetical protein
MTDESLYVIVLTGRKGVSFVREKYWTGVLLERSPEYLADPARAIQLPLLQAKEALAGFRSRGYQGRVSVLTS